MPMQATTTMPLFSAALRPDRSPRITGGWLTLGVAMIFTAPMAIVVPEMLLPAGVALAAGFAAMTGLSIQQSRRRQLRQQVTLWQDQLEVVTSSGKGDRVLQRFDPAKVRLVLLRDENEKTTSLRLRSGKAEFEIGAFLSTEDKSSFAKVFGTALRRARQAG
jgi:uncharacterized membrane protein